MKQKILAAIALVVVVVTLWWFGKVAIEAAFPAPPGGTAPWAERGQFGDMFGSVTSLMTAINLALLVYAILLQVNEASRQNEISKWQANYSYLLDAKKLITEHPEVLELHGLPANLPEKLGVTAAQVAYVVIDLKAADLYYRIDGEDPIQMTEYRLNLLRCPKYRTIARGCVVAGTLLPQSPFAKALREELDKN